MKILFSFVGGPFNGAMLSGYSEVRTREDLAAASYYQASENGSVGSRFTVPRADGEHVYEVSRRTETGSCVIVRANHLTSRHQAGDREPVVAPQQQPMIEA